MTSGKVDMIAVYDVGKTHFSQEKQILLNHAWKLHNSTSLSQTFLHMILWN